MMEMIQDLMEEGLSEVEAVARLGLPPPQVLLKVH